MSKKTKEWICSTCKSQGSPVKVTKGSFIIELALWFLFILPGVLYSLWRLSSKYDACPQCRGATMIPLNTPKGQELAAESKRGEASLI